MSKDFQTIFVQMRRPTGGDPGATEAGYFRVENNDVVVLVDINGNPRLNKKGKRLEYKLKPGKMPGELPRYWSGITCRTTAKISTAK